MLLTSTNGNQPKPIEGGLAISSENRFSYLDGLRGWAALSVVICHGTLAVDDALFSGQQHDSRGAWDVWLSGSPFLPIGPFGNLAVCIFFALSGFVLAHAYSRSRQSWPALAVRRLVRLGFPMLVACLASWVLLVSGMMSPAPASLVTRSAWLGSQMQQTPDLLAAALEPVKTLAGRPTDGYHSFDAALWTMPIEAVGSLIVLTVLLGFRMTQRRRDRLAGYAFALIGVLWIGSYLGLFGVGAALRLLRPTRFLNYLGRRPGRTAAMLVVGFFLGTVTLSDAAWPIYRMLTDLPVDVLAHTRPARWRYSPDAFYHAFGAVLILLAVCSAPRVQAILSSRFSRFLGRISFPLYVLHLPILMAVQCAAILLLNRIGFPAFPASLISLALFVVVALLAAAVFTPAIEGIALELSARIGLAVDRLMRLLPQPART